MIEHFLLWLSMALISLALMTYSDLVDRKVDGRRNSLMIGAGIVFGVYSLLLGNYFIFLIVLILFKYGLGFLEKLTQLKVFGIGDQGVLMWLVPSLLFVEPNAPIYFMVLLTFVLILTGLIQYSPWKLKEKLPGLVLIDVAFLLTLALFV